MTGEKKELLDRTFQTFMEIGFGQRNLHLLDEIVAKNVVGFGTAIDERLFGIAQLEELLTRQKQQSAGLEMKWELTILDLHISSDENTAVFTNEVTLDIPTDREPIKMYVRFSVVLEFEQHKWVVVHWHGSKPEQVESEKDTWGLDLWKAKADELEKLVAERTAELLVKNRELEVEAALERVRSRSMAMQKSEELREVIQLVFEQFRLLNFTIDSAQFDPDYKASDDLNLWSAVPGQPYSTFQHIPYFDNPIFNSIKEAKEKNLSFLAQKISFEHKNEFFRHFFKHITYVPKERQKFILESPGFYRAVVFLDNITLAIQNYSNVPYTNEEIAVLKRFGKTFEQVYTRFLDLQKAEAQAREARIEAALEKVRSRSLAMHKADELLQVATVMRAEMAALGVEELETSSIYTMLDPETAECWFAIKDVRGQNSSLVFDEMTINLNATYVGRQMLEFFKSAAPQTSILMIGEQRKEWINYCASCSSLLKGYYGDEIPERTYHLVKFSHGYVGAATPGAISTESWSLLHRMTAVFSLAYTRFLDLQKAEAQAREAQIEAALERVRATSMAMHSSKDLFPVIQKLTEQLADLNIHFESASFLKSYVHPNVNLWISTKLQPYPADIYLPYFSHPIIDAYTNPGKSASEQLNQISFKKEKDDFFKVFFGLEALKNIPAERVKYVMDTEGYCRSAFQVRDIWLTIAKYGISPFSDEENQIFRRFAKVFEQSYTRFLDLQKAEAQAREAQIEAALERVRSSSMAMHKSEELHHVINIVAEQITGLGIKYDGVSFTKVNADKSWEQWIATPTQPYPFKVHIPYLDHPMVNSAIDAWRNDTDFIASEYSFEEKNRFFDHFFENTIAKNIPAERKKFVMQSKGLAISAVPTKSLLLSIYNYECVPFSNQENEVLKRFAKVFEQAYTRFLDLQKAEEQAREAQIQLGLERVRARTMAMQKQQDLFEVVNAFGEQLLALGLRVDYVSFINGTISKDRDWDLWGCNPNLKLPADHNFIPYKNTAYFTKTAESVDRYERTGYPIQVKTFNREEKDEFFDHYFSYAAPVPHEFKQFLYDAPGSTIVDAFLGEVTVSLCRYDLEPFTQEQLEIFKRFSIEFRQAYIRFLDLQKAEAQAREAQIEAALEKVRSRTMAMQSSNELQETAVVLFQEFKKLGIENVTQVTIGIYHEDEQLIDFSATSWSGSGEQENGSFKLDMNEPIVLRPLVDAWKANEKSKTIDLTGETLEKWLEYRNRISGITVSSSDTQGRRLISVAYFSKGHISISSPLPVPAVTIKTLERFAAVFDGTYTRFLDLQKAEAQAREAQIEAALERVRSKAMAMHNSSDLPSTAIIAFSELKKLGFVPIRGGISIQNKENRKNLLYSATSSDKADNLSVVGWATLDNHPILSEIYNQWLLGNDYYPSMKGKVLQAYYKQIQPTFNIPLQFPDEEQFGYFMHFTHGTFYGWCKQAVTEEEKKLLKRFAAVVDLTFKRYFDLQKAEEQAKEAKIEAALERVRAKAMAMHSSDELREVVHELRKQMGILGQKNLETCVIHLHDESHEYIQSWAGIKPPDEEGDILESIANVPKRGLSIIEEALDAYNSNLQDYVLLNEGEKLRQWFSFLERESPEGFTKLVDSVHGNIEELRSYWSFADFAGGSLLMVTRDGPDELTRGLLRRFSNVFGLAYRRFADLKNAEAQAREARIEAALERVRSRSMAMHKSEELKEVIQVVYEQIVQLKIPTEHAGFIMDYKRRDDFDSWIADQFGSPSQLTIPYFDCIYYNRFNEAKAKGEDFFTTILSFEEKNRFYEELFEHIPDFPEESKNIIFSQPGFTISTVLLESVALYIENFTGISFSEEENAILMRFGKVFQQTYTRFLDLQKAEAQAREAEIQLALERVRAKTMAMQSSEELADAAYVLFEQLRSLGVTHERINIGIVNEDSQTIDFWITEQGGDKLNTKFSGRISEPTTLSKAYTAWKNGEKSLMIDLRGDALKSWLSYLNDEIKIPFNKAFLHDRRVQTAGFFSKGMLILTSPEPLQQEALYLLEKFAGVFDLTYTRFSDLKLAEAQALQAEKDLLEIKIARQKAEEALAELKSTQAQLIQQEKLASLGQLTAGIAHEIKNPLNFVNNFSEVSIEMIGEVIDSRLKTQDTRPKTEADEIEDEILEDIKANLEKIHEHGSRANSIVTSMLQHSRGGSGKKEPTDLNALIKEYVNLSFHGMRAGKNPIDVEIALELDDTIKEIPLVREDFTRVIINLCNNAFDAMRQKFNSELKIMNSELYHPKLTVRTKSEKDHILISVEDNGPGIPDEIKDKILQPFFTTKKGTEGTGLGLSITHDIVKAHGGELKIESTIGKGSEFVIQLPRS